MSHRLLVRELTRQEQQELTSLLRTSRDARVARRAQIILLCRQGKTASEIASLWGLTAQGIRKTIKRFNAGGLASLADQHRGGRPAKATERYVSLLKEAVQVNPRDHGYPFSCWTLERLREHLARQTHIVLHPNYLSTLMAKNGIVYRRPKHGMSHLRDPQEYDEKKAFLEFVKKGQHVPRPASTCSTSMSVRFTSTRP
jgi:transposase